MLKEILDIIKNEYTINNELDLYIFDKECTSNFIFIIKYNELENKVTVYQKETEFYLDDVNEYIEPIGFIKNVNNKKFIDFLSNFINAYDINILNHKNKEIIKHIVISNDNIIIS